MFQILSEYLFRHRKLYVPEIGTFTVDAQNAVNDFTAQTIHAPGWNILFTPTSPNDLMGIGVNNDQLFNWLGTKLNVSRENAIQKYESFGSEIKSQINNGKTVDWSGLGKLEMVNRKVVFTPVSTTNSLFTGVTARKVLRENASHNVLVGEKEVTSEEMMLLLEKERSGGSIGKFILWTIFFILLAALVYYLFFRA